METPGETSHWHHNCKPDPFVYFLQEYSSNKSSSQAQESSSHKEGNKGNSSKLVTPTSNVESKQNWNNVFRKRDDIVKTDYL